MSADNYYVIRVHPLGGFCAVMGFASDDREPVVNAKWHAPFASIAAACESVEDAYTEYGTRVHPECRETSAGGAPTGDAGSATEQPDATTAVGDSTPPADPSARKRIGRDPS